jgi:outer membrane protein
MNSFNFARLAGSVAAASLLACAGAASAQQAAASQPAPQLQSGPPIAGVCIFSQAAAVGTSAVGKAIDARMGQLKATVNAELQPEGAAIDTDIKTFQTQQASLTPDARNQRGAALQSRAEAYERKRQIRGQELQLTERKALARVYNEMTPILRTVYQQRNCAVLLDGQAVLGANEQMDLTPAVVSQLNTKLSTLQFDRERLDQAAAAPAAPKPAAGKKQ